MIQDQTKEKLLQLEQTMDAFSRQYNEHMPGVYSFIIEKTECPDELFVEKKMKEDSWSENVCSFLYPDYWGWRDEDKRKAFKEKLGPLVNTIVNTFRELNAEIFEATDECITEYTNASTAVEFISMRFLHIADEWYIMTFEWSD